MPCAARMWRSLPTRLRVVGVAQAGGGETPAVGSGEAMRIFTGAALPADADTIVIQEETEAAEGWVTIRAAPPPGRFVRPAAGDFRAGESLLAAGRRLDARGVALAAAAGAVWLKVRRRPRIAILATGDELALPGEADGTGRLVNANSLLLAGEVRRAGGLPIDLGVVGDDRDAIAARPGGGRRRRCARHHRWRLGRRLRPGSGRPQRRRLPAGVQPGSDAPRQTARLRPSDPGPPGDAGARAAGQSGFRRRHRAALPRPADRRPPRPWEPAEAARLIEHPAELAENLAANDAREDYLRATLTPRPGRLPLAAPFLRQDSALLRLYAAADALIVRPPSAPAAAAGETVPILLLG